MDRRGFIGSILAACAAPAIVRADSLMRVMPRDVAIIQIEPALDSPLWGKGIATLESERRLRELEKDIETIALGSGFTGILNGIVYYRGKPFGSQMLVS